MTTRPWTPEEENILRQEYGKRTYKAIGLLLNRPMLEVKYRAKTMGILWPRIYAANNARDNEYMKKVHEELT